MAEDDPSDACPSHFTYDESPSEATIKAVAWQTGRDPTDLEPLYAVIDPDALDELIESVEENDLSVEFGYEGCVVTVVSGGDLYVRSTPDLTSVCRNPTEIVLLLDEPPDSPVDPSAAFHVPPVSIEDADTLVVTFSAEAAEEWRDVVDAHTTDRPTDVRILLAGDFTRSNGPPTEANGRSNGVQFDTVPDPTDLTALGLLITYFLDGAESTDNRTVVCFQSISGLLQHVSLEETFHFLNLVVSRLRIAGAAGYFYLDPTAHDEQTRLTLRSLFDAVATRSTDGQWTMRTD